MEKALRNEKILTAAAGILLLSIILMTILILVILIGISPVKPTNSAVIITSVIIIIHLIVFASYIKFIKENKRNNQYKKGEYIGVSIALIVLGLLYIDAAFAAYDNHNIFSSVLMFISAFCDFVASIITIVVYYLKPQK